MRDTSLYLKDILNAIDSIENFIKDMDFDSFKNDDKTTSAVIRKLEIIGEATKKIPLDIKDKYKDIHWKEMAGMRDILIHFYFGVNYKIIWKTLKYRLPKVKVTIKQILVDYQNEKQINK